MKVAYVTTVNDRDVSTWSGTTFHMARSLAGDGTDVESIGLVREPHRMRQGLKRRLYKAMRKSYQPYRNTRVARQYAAEAARRIAQSSATLVLGPGAIPLAYLETELPVAIWADATFAGLVGYYPEFAQLARETLRDGYSMEKSFFARAAAAIFSSEWAAGSAMRTYGLDPSVVHVVPYGANLKGAADVDQARAIARARPRRECRLLFVGRDWRRKGGEIALAVAEGLIDRGLPTTLSIVGCRPQPSRPLPRHVKVEGFFNQDTTAGRARLHSLFAASHFLLLPTAAETFGIVLAEAGAHAVPSLATDTGGIPTVVRPGRNGELFRLGDVDAYCACVDRLFANYDEYMALAESSFCEARDRLDWSISAAAVRRILRSVMS